VLVLVALLAGAACAAVLVVGVRHAAPVLPLAVTSVVFAGAIVLRVTFPRG
jgi:hypothetical protein